MSEIRKTVVDLVDEAPPIDNSELFAQLWRILSDVARRIFERFELEQDPSTKELEEYGAKDGPRGSLRAFSGPEMDWMIHSWVGNPEVVFTNIHVTTWLAATTKVPHLAFAFGTLPRPWFLIDYQARSDLQLDTESLFKYYDEVNEKWLEVKERPGFDFFLSRYIYVRQALSEVPFLYMCDDTPDNIDFMEKLAHDEADRWFRWLDEADPLPVAERAAVAERDLAVRRNIAELDPANVMADRYFGEDMRKKLVRALWGGDRQLPRPDIS